MLTLKVWRKYFLTSHIVTILQGHGDTKRKTVKKTVKKTGKKALPRSGQRAGSNTSKKKGGAKKIGKYRTENDRFKGMS